LIIKLESLYKTFGDFKAVNNLDLEVQEGEIFGIIGHNGAGKTTTIMMVVGLMNPTSGYIEVLGQDMTQNNIEVKRNIGYLPEESPLYENMTVHQYLTFFADLYGLSRQLAEQRINSLLESLDLAEKNRYCSDLSKGMKRKVAIARTLLHDPALLVLDEPNSGLDPLTSFFIIDYLKTLNKQGKTIILSAHNLFHIEYICDRVAILKNGELIVCDTVEAMRKSVGKREYEIIFSASGSLNYARKDGNYVFRTSDITLMASVLQKISDNHWALVDVSVRQSALEDIYVGLMLDKQDVEEADQGITIT